ncbi:hypothetical protein ACQPXS_03090 [Streptomyces sp. CA-142005]|uniref:hypothetical protein n=1 Tax=Streptomyces sp. CA-142005 TaxID=3240052 RepID=UPI003D8A5C15
MCRPLHGRGPLLGDRNDNASLDVPPPADPTVGQEQRGDLESARGSLGDVQDAGDH